VQLARLPATVKKGKAVVKDTKPVQNKKAPAKKPKAEQSKKLDKKKMVKLVCTYPIFHLDRN
jgi:hypothetical protein